MKLIQILALATVMATAAAAQNAANTAGGAQAKPSPTPNGKQTAGPKPTPAKAKPATAKTATTKTATTKTQSKTATPKPVHPAAAGATKPATAKNAKAPSNTPQPAGKSATTAKKPVVQTGVVPEKKKTGAQKATIPHAPTPANTKVTKAPLAAGKSASSKGTAPVPPNPMKAKATVAAKTAAAPSAKKPLKKTVVSAHAPEPKPKVSATGPSTMEKKPAPRLIGSAGRRDPFISPIRSAGAVSPTQSCTSGKRCLAIPELTLQGTVRDISGKMMAVVSTSNRRTYTLRENDQVFNGSVEKITSDSIIFREYVKDAVGRESAKEVVKKMGPTS